MRKIFFIMVCIITISFAGNVHSDIHKCTEMFIDLPASIEARICAVKGFEKLEKEMNVLVKAVIGELKKCPKCSEIQNEEVFLKAQETWKQYRDTNCMLEYDFSSMMTPLYLCKARLTENRIQVLKNYLACKEGKSCDSWPISSSVEPCKTNK